jgi:hypothetical protein
MLVCIILYLHFNSYMSCMLSEFSCTTEIIDVVNVKLIYKTQEMYEYIKFIFHMQ